MNVVKSFIRCDRRLIYSGVHDDSEGVKAWIDEPDRHIRLTWSGLRYIRDLSTLPAYVQWAFASQHDLQARSHRDNEVRDDARIEGRMMSAPRCFQTLVDSELDAVDQMRKKILTNYPKSAGEILFRSECFRCGAPVFDVFVGASGHFLISIANAIKGIEARKSKLSSSEADRNTVESLHSIMTEWVFSLEELSRRYSYFKIENESWNIDIGFIRLSYDQFKKNGGMEG